MPMVAERPGSAPMAMPRIVPPTIAAKFAGAKT